MDRETESEDDAMQPDDEIDDDDESRDPDEGPSGLPIYDAGDANGLADDIEDEVEFEDDDETEEGPRTVLITGACGNIGRKLRAAWYDTYDLILIDIAATHEEPEVIAADLAELDDDWIGYFHGVDTVIHLAANPNDLATWEELERPNLDALSNVFHASALAGVERLVFASSNHAMGGYRVLGDMPITVDLPPRPDGPYGATKLMGERLGRSLALAFDLSFVALRLGWNQEGANRPDTLPDDWARSMWLSNADLIRLFECAVEADLGESSFAVVNGISNNRGSRWDLTGAAELLDFLPEDDAYTEEL
jgi:NAD dependent epimerase/dehydratase family